MAKPKPSATLSTVSSAGIVVLVLALIVSTAFTSTMKHNDRITCKYGIMGLSVEIAIACAEQDDGPKGIKADVPPLIYQVPGW